MDSLERYVGLHAEEAEALIVRSGLACRTVQLVGNDTSLTADLVPSRVTLWVNGEGMVERCSMG
jgi:Potato inhibitor I family